MSFSHKSSASKSAPKSTAASATTSTSAESAAPSSTLSQRVKAGFRASRASSAAGSSKGEEEEEVKTGGAAYKSSSRKPSSSQLDSCINLDNNLDSISNEQNKQGHTNFIPAKRSTRGSRKESSSSKASPPPPPPTGTNRTSSGNRSLSNRTALPAQPKPYRTRLQRKASCQTSESMGTGMSSDFNGGTSSGALSSSSSSSQAGQDNTRTHSGAKGRNRQLGNHQQNHSYNQRSGVASSISYSTSSGQGDRSINTPGGDYMSSNSSSDSGNRNNLQQPFSSAAHHANGRVGPSYSGYLSMTDGNVVSGQQGINSSTRHGMLQDSTHMGRNGFASDIQCDPAPWSGIRAPLGFRREKSSESQKMQISQQSQRNFCSPPTMRSSPKDNVVPSGSGLGTGSVTGAGGSGGSSGSVSASSSRFQSNYESKNALDKHSEEAPEQDLYRALDFLYDSPQLLDKQHPPVTVLDQLEADRLQSSLLYGEILYPGVRVLLNSNHLHAAEATTLYDLGMGCGRLVSQAFIEYPNLQRVVGVELAYSRFFSACDAAAALAKAHGWPLFATVSDVNAATAAAGRVAEELSEMIKLGRTDPRGISLHNGSSGGDCNMIANMMHDEVFEEKKCTVLDESDVGEEYSLEGGESDPPVGEFGSQEKSTLSSLKAKCNICGCTCKKVTNMPECVDIQIKKKRKSSKMNNQSHVPCGDLRLDTRRREHEKSSIGLFSPLVMNQDDICGCPAFEHLPSDLYYEQAKTSATSPKVMASSNTSNQSTARRSPRSKANGHIHHSKPPVPQNGCNSYSQHGVKADDEGGFSLRRRLYSGLYSEGARGELHRRLATDRSFPDSNYGELVTSFARHGFYPGKHLSASEVVHLTSLTVLAPCEDHFACNSLAPVGCPLVENKDASIGVPLSSHVGAIGSSRPTIPGLPPGAVLTDAELHYHRQLQLQQQQQSQGTPSATSHNQNSNHNITTPHIAPATSSSSGLSSSSLSGSSSPAPVSLPPVPGASVTPGPIPDSLAPYDAREIDVLGRRDAPFGSNAAALALTCSRHLGRQVSSSSLGLSQGAQSSALPPSHNAQVGNSMNCSGGGAGDAEESDFDCPPSVMPGAGLFRRKSLLANDYGVDETSDLLLKNEERASKNEGENPSTCSCGCDCGGDSAKSEDRMRYEAHTRALSAVTDLRKSAVVHSYFSSEDALAMKDIDRCDADGGEHQASYNSRSSNSNDQGALGMHKFPPRVRCWVPGCKRYCRQLQLRRGNLFEATDGFQADIVVIEVKIRPPLFYKLRSFLRCLKPGARLLTYEDLIEVFNGCAHESGKEAEEAAMRQLVTGQYISALRAQAEESRAAITCSEKMLRRQYETSIAEFLVRKKNAKNRSAVSHKKGKTLVQRVKERKSSGNAKKCETERKGETERILSSKHGDHDEDDDIGEDDDEGNYDISDMSEEEHAQIPSLSSKFKTSFSADDSPPIAPFAEEYEGAGMNFDSVDADYRAHASSQLPTRQLLSRWMGFTGIMCYGKSLLPPHILELPMGAAIRMAALGTMLEMKGGINSCLCCEHYQVALECLCGSQTNDDGLQKCYCLCTCHNAAQCDEEAQCSEDNNFSMPGSQKDGWSRLHLQTGRSKLLRPLPSLPSSLDLNPRQNSRTQSQEYINEGDALMLPCICCCNGCVVCGRSLTVETCNSMNKPPNEDSMQEGSEEMMEHSIHPCSVVHPCHPIRTLHSICATQPNASAGSMSAASLSLLQPCHPLTHPILEFDVSATINSNGVTNGTGSRVATLPPAVLTFSPLVTGCLRGLNESAKGQSNHRNHPQTTKKDNLTCKCSRGSVTHVHFHHPYFGDSDKPDVRRRAGIMSSMEGNTSSIAYVPPPSGSQNGNKAHVSASVTPHLSNQQIPNSGSTPSGASSPSLSTAASAGAAGALEVHTNTSQFMHEVALAQHPPSCCLRLHPVPAGTTPTCAYGCPASVAYSVPCLRLPFNTSADRVPTSWAPYLHHRFHIYQLKA